MAQIDLKDEFKETFFDADTSSALNDGSRQTFDGHVLMMGAGIMIASDHLNIDQNKKRLEANGHVLILTQKQIFGGKSLLYDLNSGHFTIEDSWIIASDPAKASAIINKLLGISLKELNFESAQASHLKRLQEKKEDLVRTYLIHKEKNENEKITEIINAYAILLQQLDHVANQQTPILSELPESAREKIKARRQFWKTHKAAAFRLSNQQQNNYFKIEGQTIKRVAENSFSAKDAFFTPCNCEEETSPPWGFRAKTIDATTEQYVDLYDPAIEIKGLPVIYFPYLRFPIKTQRQSGLLFPALTYSKNNGSVFSQPLFIDIDDHTDATITADYFGKRGFRLGSEYRYEKAEHSGWRLEIEGMKDQLWLGQIKQRQQIIDRYYKGFSNAFEKKNNISSIDNPFDQILSSASWWNSPERGDLRFCFQTKDPYACFNEMVRDPLTLPMNPWRGQLQWRGQNFLNPRMMFVSQGSLLSDHRYLGDVFLPSAEESFLQSEPKLYDKSKWLFHIDERHYYLGFGSSFGDDMLTANRFSNIQKPFELHLQSKLVPILTEKHFIPIYAHCSYDANIFSSFDHIALQTDYSDQSVQTALGKGSWQRLKVSFVSPLVPDEIISIDHFTDFEARAIHDSFMTSYTDKKDQLNVVLNKENQTTIRSFRTGFNFNLPLEGFMLLSEKNPSEKSSYLGHFLEHRMNWQLTLSARPVVIRKGPHGNRPYRYDWNDTNKNWTQGRYFLSYYESDLSRPHPFDMIDDTASMYLHRKVILSTNHNWFLFDESWSIQPKNKNSFSLKEEDKNKHPDHYFKEKAKYDLESYLNEDTESSIFDSNARLIQSNRTRPLSFFAQISYDFLKEKERKEQNKTPGISSDQLAQPWSALNTLTMLNLDYFSLSQAAKYDIYLHGFSFMRFGLDITSIFGISPSFVYLIERQGSLSAKGAVQWIETRTKEASFSGFITPQSRWSASYGKKENPENPSAEQRTAKIYTSYLSDTDCWGLKFQWEKPYGEKNWHRGTFFAGLIVKFFGQYREYGNFLSRFNDHDI